MGTKKSEKTEKTENTKGTKPGEKELGEKERTLCARMLGW